MLFLLPDDERKQKHLSVHSMGPLSHQHVRHVGYQRLVLWTTDVQENGRGCEKTACLCPSGRLPESIWRGLAYIFNKPSKWVHREPELLTAQLWNVASRAPVRLMRMGLVKISLQCKAHCKNEEVLKYLALRRYTVKSPYIYLVWRLTKWIVTILHGDVIGVAVIPVTMRWDRVWYPLALPP